MKKPIQFGKYYLLERVNVGGMAEVFKAKTVGVEGFERLLAVKRILPNIAEDSEFISMFIDEAKIAVQFSHANIAQIFDLGKVDDAYFIALEYVAGKDLRAIFDRCRQQPERGSVTMPIAQACYAITKICEGLDYAHNKRDAAGKELHLVHRDVSPQNVMVSYEGEVKLIDFGIAKAAGKASKTQAGILKGKFGYMSPEQVRGLPLDRRSDVFSVGIVLYELLTGERLFVGESDFSTLEKVRNVEILPPSAYNRKIPEELERIALKALAKDVGDRYQSAIDLHDDLQAFLYGAGEQGGRKELAAWMKAQFAGDIAAEQARDEAWAAVALGPLVEGARGGPPPGPPSPGPPAPPPPRGARGARPPAAAPPAAVAEAAEALSWDDDEIDTHVYGAPGEAGPGADQDEGAAVGARVDGPPLAATSSFEEVGSDVQVIDGAELAEEGSPELVEEGPPRAAAIARRAGAPTAAWAASSSAPGTAGGPGAEAPVTPLPPPPLAMIPTVQSMLPSVPTAVQAAPAGPLALPPSGAVPAALPRGDSGAALRARGTSTAHQSVAAGAADAARAAAAMARSATPMPSLGTAASPPAGSPRPTPGAGTRTEVVRPIPATSLEHTRKNAAPPSRTLGVAALGLAVGAGLLWVATRPREGELQLAVAPCPGLAVLVDGQPVPAGELPRLRRAAGTHAVQIDCPGYQGWRERVDLRGGALEARQVTLAPLPRAAFRITEPVGATVTVDGQRLASLTPFQVDGLLAGRHRIEVAQADKRWSAEVELAPGAPLEVKPVLAEVPAAAPVLAEAPPAPGPEGVTGGGAQVVATSLPAAAASDRPARRARGDDDAPVRLVPLDEGGGATAPRPVGSAAVATAPRVVEPAPSITPRALPASPALVAGEPPPRLAAAGAHAIPVERAASASPTAAPRTEPRVAASTPPRALPPSPPPPPSVDKPVPAPAPRALDKVAPAPAAAEGFLRLGSKPWTNIAVDGRDLGLRTPQVHLRLGPGAHKVTLTNPEFGINESFTVEIHGGETETVIKDLRPQAGAE